MSTHEEDLKQIDADIELIEAEIASNEEEIDRINPIEGTVKRERYLKIRNKYLQNRLAKLNEQRKDKVEVIEWDKRTR
ncbi:MAG: hypothetical protein WC708_01130 [Lentisphaeria bacterium]|jgi:hypothetical protein